MCFREMKCDECQKFFRQKSFLTCTYSVAKENMIYSTKISKYSEKDQIIQFEGRLGRREGDRHPKQEGKVQIKTFLKGNIYHFICHVSG